MSLLRRLFGRDSPHPQQSTSVPRGAENGSTPTDRGAEAGRPRYSVSQIAHSDAAAQELFKFLRAIVDQGGKPVTAVMLLGTAIHDVSFFERRPLTLGPLEGEVQLPNDSVWWGADFLSAHIAAVWEALTRLPFDLWSQDMDAFIGAVLPTIEGDLPGTEGYKSAVGMILDLTMRVLLQHTLSPRDTTSEIQKKLADALRSIEDEALRANLYRATHSGHASEVKMLLERGADPNARNQMGVPALHSAAMGGHAAVVEMLLGRGAAVDPRTPDGATPLLGAVLEGHADVVRLLLRAGADPNAALPDGASALYFAAYARAPPIAKLLLAAGAKARAADENGHTPLHEAAFQGNAETVELLLKAGADANAKGRDGNTPLHLAACGSGDLAVVRSLLAHGAVADVREFEHGLTPRDCAAAKGYRDVVAILNQASRTRPSDNGA